MPAISLACCGGRHGEAAAIRTLLAQADMLNPLTSEPLSEALCFGIAGGIGAGYSFCPSIPRSGNGSGVTIVGRHKSYATNAAWYQGCFDRLGVQTRITETAAGGKAFANLLAEIGAGRPTVVWCSGSRLPFLHSLQRGCDCEMHSFVVCEIDEQRGIARGCDRAPTPVSIGLSELAAARGGICSHKNRTLTIEPPPKLTKARLKTAVLAGIEACLDDLYRKPKIKTFSLPAWKTLEWDIDNRWPTIFTPGQLYQALRDAFISIETAGTGGGLFRNLFADFLDEAAEIIGKATLRRLALRYREEALCWSQTGYFLLPRDIPPLDRTRKLLVKQRKLFEGKGAKADKQMAAITEELRSIAVAMDDRSPLTTDVACELLHGVRCRIASFHASETYMAEQLAAAVA